MSFTMSKKAFGLGPFYPPKKIRGCVKFRSEGATSSRAPFANDNEDT